VGREDHDLARPPLLLDHGEDDLLGGGIDPVERLVEQEQVGLLRECSREEHPLLLAAGELADLGPRLGRETDPIQHPVDDRVIPPPRPPEPPGAGVASHQDDLPHGDGKRPVHHLPLRHVGDPRALERRGPPEQRDAPPEKRDQAQDRLEERALTASVGTDDSDDVPPPDLGPDVAQDHLRAVCDGHVAENEPIVLGRRTGLPRPPLRDRATRDRRPHFSASAIVRALASHIPSTLSAPLPGAPSESP
jgi:hypothetical protein